MNKKPDIKKYKERIASGQVFLWDFMKQKSRNLLFALFLAAEYRRLETDLLFVPAF